MKNILPPSKIIIWNYITIFKKPW